ncbi:hypothetical protein [Spirochaeta thermophila]|uniref:DUF7847 domain-containing protein n=1 Tax=Winmispira thermophila (strain ATCC 49972 / DSM 6192 / RI 19.B1) TaxID=665571 RepID=E0RTI8_WINT6|nr:hypothetical protein [Spirochaeta thermophila]ADN02219.1 hypothetical protein STHERM_c12780 [Spirochaeta thermophila DSM 6192]
MEERVRTYGLGEMLGTTFRVTGELWRPFLVVWVCLWGFTGVFLAGTASVLPGIMRTLVFMGEELSQHYNRGLDLMQAVLARFGRLWVWELVLMLVQWVGTLVVGFLAWDHVHRGEGNLPGALEGVVRALGRLLLQWLVVAGLVLLSLIGLGVVGAVGGFLASLLDGRVGSVLITVLIVLLVVAWYVFLVWFLVAVSFAAYAVIFEDRGAWAGIRRSLELVSGSWWRVFGYLLLFWLLVGFMGLLLSFLVQSPLSLSLFSRILLSPDPTNLEDLVSRMLSFYSSPWVWVGVWVVEGIQLIGSHILAPVFTALLFVDLSVRKNAPSSDVVEPEAGVPPEGGDV